MDGITTSNKHKNLLLSNPFITEYKSENINGKIHDVGYISCKECGRYFGKSLSIKEIPECHKDCMVIKSLTSI